MSGTVGVRSPGCFSGSEKHSKARPTQETILYNKSLGTDMLQKLMNNNYTR